MEPVSEEEIIPPEIKQWIREFSGCWRVRVALRQLTPDAAAAYESSGDRDGGRLDADSSTDDDAAGGTFWLRVH
eukprot:3629-Eustigmatos_ZCMA.PRE.1